MSAGKFIGSVNKRDGDSSDSSDNDVGDERASGLDTIRENSQEGTASAFPDDYLRTNNSMSSGSEQDGAHKKISMYSFAGLPSLPG